MAEKSIKKNAIYSAIHAVMVLAFPVISFPYASRILMPEGIGKVNFATSVMGYFTLLAGLGISSYSIREASKVRQDKLLLSKFVKEIFFISLFSTFFSYIVFFISLISVPKFEEYRSLLLIFSSTIIFSSIGLEWLYSALEEFRYIAIRSFIFHCVSIVFLFIFVRTKDDYLWYAVFGIICSIGCNICNFFYARRFLDFTIKIKLEFKRHIKPIFTFFGMSLITTVYTMFDSIMLGFLASDTEVGYYSAATKLNRMILGLLTAITAVLLPRLTLFMQNKDRVSFNLLTEKAMCVITLLGVPFVVGLILLAEPLVLLFSGQDYYPAVLPMQVISPIMLVISISSFTGTQILPSLQKEKISLISYFLGAATNIAINCLLIPKYGAIGAAIGTVCAETIIFAFQGIYLRRILVKRTVIINLLQSIVATLGMGFVVHYVIANVHGSVLQLAFGFVSGFITYGLLLFLLGTKYFKLYLFKFVKKVLTS